MSYRNNSTQQSQSSPNMPERTTHPDNSTYSARQDDASAADNDSLDEKVHRCARCYDICNSADELRVHSLACGVAALITGMFTPFDYPASSGPSASLFGNSASPSPQVADQTSNHPGGRAPPPHSQHERTTESRSHQPFDPLSPPELARYHDGGSSTKPRGFTGRGVNTQDVFRPESVGQPGHVHDRPASDPANLTDHQSRRSAWYPKPPKDYRQ